MTPHNSAQKGDFAKTVLMPGDPLRAKYIAENFLQNARLVNSVRGIMGYTGEFDSTPVSVMASGMGMPSIGIYSYELYHDYDVENIIRVGSAGAYSEKVELRDIILAQSASYDSAFASQYNLPGTFSAACDYSLLSAAAHEAGDDFVHIGAVLSSDVFYNDNPSFISSWQKMGILAVEMEAAALYMTAARLNRRALAILTVSDHLVKGGALTSDERERNFNRMIEIALKTAVRIEKK